MHPFLHVHGSCTYWRGQHLKPHESGPAQGASAISKLPPYLNVQMVRFFYKVDVRQKAKILRKVRGVAPLAAPHQSRQLHAVGWRKQGCRSVAVCPPQVVFPLVLDAYEFCTDAYKTELDGPRGAWQAAEDARAGLERAAKKAKAKACQSLLPARGLCACPQRPWHACCGT